MSKTIEVKDIAQYEDTDSELAKYTIATQCHEIKRLQNILNQIEGALYNENLSNMYCRITIQEILDKENENEIIE